MAPPRRINVTWASASVERRGLISQSAASFATGVVVSALGLVSGIVAARSLGPTGRGSVAILQIVVATGAVLGGLGLPDAIIYFANRRSLSANELMAQLARTALVASAAIAALAAGATAAIWHLLRIKNAWPFAAYCLIIVPQVQLALAIGSLRAQGRAVAWNLVRLGMALTWLAAVAVRRGGVSGVLEVHVGLTMLLYLAVRRSVTIGEAQRSRQQSLSIREALHYGAPSALIGLPVLINSRVDQVIVAANASVGASGVYAAAAGLATGAFLMPQSVAMAIFPATAKGSLSSARSNGRFVRYAFACCILLSLAYGLACRFSWSLLFDSRYSAGRTVVLPLSVAWGIAGFNSIMEESLRGQGRSRVPLLSQIVCAGATIFFVLLLSRSGGIFGASIGSLIGFLFGTVLLVLIARSASVNPNAGGKHLAV
jgi:O-antigen/teichoic acid export membrane protein